MFFDLSQIFASGFRYITSVLLVAVVSLAFNVIEIRCQSGGQSHLSTKATDQIVVPMSVDVDGAPTSFGPDDIKALDYELNAHVGAKKTGRIVGYLTDSAGNPVIQTKDDPAPGFYVSTTGYYDVKNPRANDPRRYLDASQINYTVLADSARKLGVKPGDLCVVHSIKKNTTIYGIVGDTGHSSGAEGSLALLQRLGYAVKNGKSVDEEITDIVVRYFAGSNPTQVFYFHQSDLDKAAKTLHFDTDFSTFH